MLIPRNQLLVARKPIGDVGLNEMGDNLSYSTEHLLELQGREGSVKYRQMSKEDGTVGMILRGYKNPILSSNWCIPKPDDSTPAEGKAIEILHTWFFEEYSTCFETLLAQILSKLEYGFSCFERTWKVWSYDGQPYLVPVLSQRLQVSIESIHPDKNMVQQQTNKNGLVEIPLDQMVFFVLNQQGWDMRGESLLRTAYRSWKRKAVYEEYMGIGFQRSMSGVPWMKVPEGTRTDSSDYIAAEQLLQNLSWHENAYMIFQEGWDFGFTDSKFDPSKAQFAIDALDKQMALSVLIQFMLLGQQAGAGGSYALSRDHSDTFLDGLAFVVTQIEKVFHRYVIAPFLQLNFGTTVDPSKVRLRGLNLNKKAGAELAEVLSKVQMSGFISPTVDDEVQLRNYLEMPELSEEDLEKRREKLDNPPPPTSFLPATSRPKGKRAEDDEEEDDESVDDDQKNLIVLLTEPRIEKRKKMLDFETQQMVSFMQGHLLLVKDKLVADVKSMLNRGVTQTKGLKNIEVNAAKYRRALEMKLAGLANGGWNAGKTCARKCNVKLSEDLNPASLPDAELKAYILNEAEALVDDQTSRMKNKAVLTASNGPVKGFSISQTVSNVEKVLDEFIKSNGVKTGGSLVVVSSINFGENRFYKEIEDEIWGYVFRAVDDGNTTEICKWYNGKTYSINSTELSVVTPPLHPNCRSFMEPIYKSEVKDRPEIEDVIAPPSIQQQKSVY